MITYDGLTLIVVSISFVTVLGGLITAIATASLVKSARIRRH